MNICKLSDCHIAYIREGKGKTILLLHGITTSSFIWKKVIPFLKQKFDVLAIDLLGCGESSKEINKDFSIKSQAIVLKELVFALNLSPIHLVGHDIGGGIAQIFAVNDPDLLLDLVLINPIGYDYWPVQPISSMRIPFIRQLSMAAFNFGILRTLIKKGLYYKKNCDNDLLTSFQEQFATPESRKAFFHLARCLNNHHLSEITTKLTTLKIPSLIIRGDHDVYLSENITQKLHQDIPFSKLVHISTAGHFIQEDEPKLLAQTIVDFYSTK